jgi:uncharacterized membrane protein
MKDKRFEKIRKGLYQELLKANLHFKTFWAVYTAPKDIAKIRNVYLTFFVLTMKSHNDLFCIAVHNAVKPHRDTANFTKLFNYIRSNQNLQNVFNLEEIEQMEAAIKSHEPLINKIAVIRNQYVAHNQLTKKHLDEDIIYKYEEGKRLLIDLNNILENVSHKYDGSRYFHDKENLLYVSPSLNVEDMLRHLTEYRNERIKKRYREHKT